MDSTHSRAGHLEHRNSTSASPRSSLSSDDRGPFADASESDADDHFDGLGVSDGFRPSADTTSLRTVTTGSSSIEIAPSVSIDISTADSYGRSESVTTPTTISKPTRDSTPLAARHDHDNPTARIGVARVQQPARTSMDSYTGPSGPSFPYHMYSQNVRVARTSSVTTASTATPSEISYNGPRGPSHPYGLYSQGTSAEVGTVSTGSTRLGFDNVPDPYQRRLGPDGEEAGDMIGPDGHTEQLPPYTRYPEETYATKVRDAEARLAAQPTTSRRLPSIAGAGGIGLAPMNPEFDRDDGSLSLQSRHSSRTFHSAPGDGDDDGASHSTSTLNEKEDPPQRWQAFARRTVGGIVPYWAICLVIAAILLMGVILGAVVGTLIARHPRPPPPHHSGANYSEMAGTPTVTVTIDASPIPTPTDLPPLATGQFQLPLSLNKSPNTCFNDTTQSQAWSCGIWYGAGMSITVDPQPGTSSKSPGYKVTMGANGNKTGANDALIYGQQPPTITEPLNMEMVNDTAEPNRGPSWFRLLHYNKTVVVEESLLSQTYPGSSDSRKTRLLKPAKDAKFGRRGSDFHRKGLAQAGEKPWVCTWPDTVLEIFIYPMQNASWSRLTPRSFDPPPARITTYLEGIPTEVPAQMPSPTRTDAAPPVAATTSTSSAGDAGPTLQPYPNVIKVEERRMSQSKSPTCRQYEVKDDGTTQPRVDEHGDFIDIVILETEQGPAMVYHAEVGHQKRDFGDLEVTPRYSTELSACGCLWMLS